MIRAALVLLALAAAVVWASPALGQETPPTNTSPEALQGEIRGLQQDIAALEREIEENEAVAGDPSRGSAPQVVAEGDIEDARGEIRNIQSQIAALEAALQSREQSGTELSGQAEELARVRAQIAYSETLLREYQSPDYEGSFTGGLETDIERNLEGSSFGQEEPGLYTEEEQLTAQVEGEDAPAAGETLESDREAPTADGGEAGGGSGLGPLVGGVPVVILALLVVGGAFYFGHGSTLLKVLWAMVKALWWLVSWAIIAPLVWLGARGLAHVVARSRGRKARRQTGLHTVDPQAPAATLRKIKDPAEDLLRNQRNQNNRGR